MDMACEFSVFLSGNRRPGRIREVGMSASMMDIEGLWYRVWIIIPGLRAR